MKELEGNGLKADRLMKEFDAFAKQYNGYVDIDIQQYISIRYKDIMDHEVHYVSPVIIYKLSEIEGKEITEQLSDSLFKYGFVNLRKISGQRLYDNWLSRIREPNYGK